MPNPKHQLKPNTSRPHYPSVFEDSVVAVYDKPQTPKKKKKIKAKTAAETMTCGSESARTSFVQAERAKGWEVFLDYQGIEQGRELYNISRQKLIF